MLGSVLKILCYVFLASKGNFLLSVEVTMAELRNRANLFFGRAPSSCTSYQFAFIWALFYHGTYLHLMYYTLLSLESVKEMGNQPTMHLHISEYKNSRDSLNASSKFYFRRWKCPHNFDWSRVDLWKQNQTRYICKSVDYLEAQREIRLPASKYRLHI